MNRIGYKNNIKKAFSFSENLTVLMVLGVIIAITVPGLINDKNQKKNRILVRKAVTSYQKLLNEEYLKVTGIRNVNRFNKILTCDKILAHYEAFNIDNTSLVCKFETSDGLNWDFSTPNKVILALNGEDAVADGAGNPKNLKVFYMTYEIDTDGIKILPDVNGVDVSKTRDFIMND